MSFMNPRRLTPSMSLLLAFDAAARHLSFTRAAAELSLTQSAVSRHVLALENLLEVPLFRREGRQIALTDIGRMYQSDVAAALQRLRNASLQAIAHRAGGGSFHLAALPTFAAKWLMPRLSRFYAAHPGILIHVHSRVGRVDFGLGGIDAVIGVGDDYGPGLVAHHLREETVLPVISPALLARQPVRTPADLARHLLLHVTARPENWRAWFEAQDLSPSLMRQGPHFELTSHLIQAVASGLGVGLLPDFLVEDELASGMLRTAIDRPFKTGASYRLWVPETQQSLPAIATFVQWLLAERTRDEAQAGRPPSARRGSATARSAIVSGQGRRAR